MSAYRYSTPRVVGYVEAPAIVEGCYAELIKAIPDGQAAILEFEDELHLKSGQSVIGDIARRDLGFKLRTKSLGYWDGKPRLLVWRVTP